MVAGSDGELKGLTMALGQELSAGLEEPMFDADRWMRAQALAEAVSLKLANGADPAAVVAMLDRLPKPRNPREGVIAHLLRAGLLRDGAAPTAALQVLIDDLNSAKPRHNLAQADYIIRGIVYAVWSNRMRLSDPGRHDLVLRQLWHTILDKYRAQMPPRDSVPVGQRQRDLIVLMTGQFVQGMHQPSIDAREFAAKLVLRFGRRVVLINTADGPVSAHYPYLGGFVSSADEELVDKTQLVIDRLPIPFIHLPPGHTDPATAAAMRDRILEMRPDLILSFGTMNPVADLCRGLLDVVSIPFGTYLPMAEPAFVALPRALVASDGPALAVAGLTADRVTNIDYCYTRPAMGRARGRADLAVPADAILTLVIGIRLTQEVTPAFAAALDAAIKAEPRLFFLFVGSLDNYDHLVAALPALAARSRAHGFDPDVIGLLEQADLFLNPPRGGGGASAAYALSSGVPAFTLNAGDVATVVGPDFHLASLGEFAPLASRFADDPEYREAMRTKARKRFAAISSRDVMLRQILDGVKALRAKG
ncbi:hypothetical protein CHU95_16280 [Niveispirillum lacus]|uniref:Glycosyl transferase family 1 domain-containing protein n=1 Tax=Niveispirillum lacus TaxID=1981099 RepID=A0A255YT50_9PROT|nr:glycosyltransferase [Niveispirillum lacus]OYQ32359.1 hypothetical protein CHU95_16280 [Niveispirillum lacus]